MEPQLTKEALQPETVVQKKKSQKEVVFALVSEALQGVELNGKSIREFLKDKSSKEAKTIKKQIKSKLMEGIKSGEIVCKKTYDEAGLSKYCSGLIGNWINKDSRYA